MKYIFYVTSVHSYDGRSLEWFKIEQELNDFELWVFIQMLNDSSSVKSFSVSRVENGKSVNVVQESAFPRSPFDKWKETSY